MFVSPHGCYHGYSSVDNALGCFQSSVCGSDALGPSIHAGFLTDSLSIHEEKDGQSKYLGVCKLPGEGRKVGGIHQWQLWSHDRDSN